MSPRRVVITGIGILSCLGNDRDQVLDALRAGRSGIELIPERKALGFRSGLGGRIKGLEPPDVPKRNLRLMGPGSYLAVHAARQATADARLKPEQVASDRTGIVIGNLGNMHDIYTQSRKFADRTEKLGGTAYQRVMGCSVSANLSVLLKTRGYSLTVTAACATGATAIGLGTQLIRTGVQDVCLAGGVQEDTWEAFCHFDALDAFSVREAEPTKASRPFDRQRDGLVPSAGCGLVVLEELEQAQRRGARIYGEVAGYAFTSDGQDMTAPSGEGSVRSMRGALAEAGLRADEVDYVNAHATSTAVGDVAEAQAIAAVFGARPWVSSTKSMTGHEQAAAGSSEVIYTLLMMAHGFVAPSINVEELDPRCEGIRLVANEAIAGRIEVAASNSFGFGGVNTCVILRRVPE
ncbi:MAG: beta-ketoacyl-[acyl-carrier-protein] synthase family protein [Candidatus Rokubacteria bacterium]|nr:beta-ketoacyl-[acyl-carrier-protein] synthase family protein [Candidatus Rokubacteria bacterium]